MGTNSSKALISPESWAARVLDQEQRELDKLEQILAMERGKAAARRRALEELEAREEAKTRAVREMVRNREI